MTATVPAQTGYPELDDNMRAFVTERASRIRQLGKRTAECVLAIGKALIEVKERLPHGTWLPWLKAEFGWSDQTARNFINVAERFKSKNFLNLDIDVSALYLIAAPKTPEPVREEAIRRAEDGQRVTHKMVVDGIADHTAEQERTTQQETPQRGARSIPILTRRQVRKCHRLEIAKKQILRIVKAYETGHGHPSIQILIISHRDGVAVGVQFDEEGRQ